MVSGLSENLPPLGNEPNTVTCTASSAVFTATVPLSCTLMSPFTSTFCSSTWTAPFLSAFSVACDCAKLACAVSRAAVVNTATVVLDMCTPHRCGKCLARVVRACAACAGASLLQHERLFRREGRHYCHCQECNCGTREVVHFPDFLLREVSRRRPYSSRRSL